jgi:3-dehydroquinate dehydratase-2
MSTTKNILILNGPNLNMLGQREPEIYGTQSLDDIEEMCRAHTKFLEAVSFEENEPYTINLGFLQSNHEGELVTWIQNAFLQKQDVIIINAAAYTHTSIAIHDALKIFKGLIIEVHLSDPETRESFRHNSYITPLAQHVIKGHGAKGYLMALDLAIA